MKLTICALAFLLLTGCMGGTTVWSKAGTTQKDLDNDRYDCDVMLGYRGHTYGSQPTDQLADQIIRGNDERHRCLERKGWKQVQQQQTQAAPAPARHNSLASPYY